MRWHSMLFRSGAELDRYILSRATYHFNKFAYISTRLWRGCTTLDPAQIIVLPIREMYCSSEQGWAIIEKWLRW